MASTCYECRKEHVERWFSARKTMDQIINADLTSVLNLVLGFFASLAFAFTAARRREYAFA